MPEPICAMLFSSTELYLEAVEDGTIQRVLGVRPDGTGRNLGVQNCDEGEFVRLALPGAAYLGARFFAWEDVPGKPYRLGRLLPAGDVVRLRAALLDAPACDREAFAGRDPVVLNVERFRAAVAARAGG